MDELTIITGEGAKSDFPGYLNTVIGFLLGLIPFIISYYISTKREKRQNINWRMSNLKPHFFDEYLSPEIKTARKYVKDMVEIKALEEKEKEVDEDQEKLTKEQIKISQSLQRIGIATYMGVIPLSFGLLMSAYQFIDDWVNIESGIEKIQESKAKENLDRVPFQRRHAEWLCLISFMWVKSQNYAHSRSLAAKTEIFQTQYGDSATILKREALLFDADKSFAHKTTKGLRADIVKKYKRLPKT